MAYLAAIGVATAVEIVTNNGTAGMSVNFMQTVVGVSTIHFGGIAYEKGAKHKNGGGK